MKSKTYSFPAQTLPLDDSWDVIVVGGGPSGSTAAAAAAREGARTLLIESTGNLGGMGTSGLVPAWCPFSDKEKIIYRGLAEEVFLQSKKSTPHVPDEQLDWVPISPEDLKRIYDELVLNSGAEILFQTTLAAVEKRNDEEIDTLIVVNKSGLTALRAKVYIDCTGDADLCFMAGAETIKGDGQGGPLMPATHCFVLTNIDVDIYQKAESLHSSNPSSPIYAIRESGKYPIIPDAHLNSTIIGPGTIGFNAGHVYDYDNTDPWCVSRALTHGRKLARAYRDALAEFVPKVFGNSYLALTGSLMGVRETRRVIGDYTLTFEDYMNRRSFADEICRNSYYIDIHKKVEEAAKSFEAMSKRSEKTSFRYGPGESHGIPYRCLTPKSLTNVLVAGRSISTEQTVQGSVRVMPNCLAMGEAAGTAAALSISSSKNGVDVHKVDTQKLRRLLQSNGAYLPDNTQ